MTLGSHVSWISVYLREDEDDWETAVNLFSLAFHREAHINVL